MQSLRAPERSPSHYRNGRLRDERAGRAAGADPASRPGGWLGLGWLGRFFAGRRAQALRGDRQVRISADAADDMDFQATEAPADDVATPGLGPAADAGLPRGFVGFGAAPRPRAAAPAAAIGEARPEPVRAEPARAEPARAQYGARSGAEPPAGTRAPKAAGRRAGREFGPSRLSYRMERLWLTPTFRRFVRQGLPVLLVTALVGGFLMSADRRAFLTGQTEALVDKVQDRPEFQVSLLSIDGASPPVADAVRALLPVQLPISSFKIDLDAFRAAITQMDAVADVTIKVRAGGILGVEVTERKPAILWRNGGALEMLDARGHRVATLLERAARPDLPVITGEGANGAVPEALAILSAARPILPEVRGLVRMGERRWDLVLDRGRRILLPSDLPVRAVEEVIALDKAEDLLARDIAVVDLRNPGRPTLRLSAAAAAMEQETLTGGTKGQGQ